MPTCISKFLDELQRVYPFSGNCAMKWTDLIVFIIHCVHTIISSKSLPSNIDCTHTLLYFHIRIFYMFEPSLAVVKNTFMLLLAWYHYVFVCTKFQPYRYFCFPWSSPTIFCNLWLLSCPESSWLVCGRVPWLRPLLLWHKIVVIIFISPHKVVQSLATLWTNLLYLCCFFGFTVLYSTSK